MKTLASIIEASNGKFVSVSFIKKDGTLRVLNGRLGVVKHLKGGECIVDRDKYIVIYDIINKGYRSINRDTIQHVTIDGRHWLCHCQVEGEASTIIHSSN